MWKVWFMLNGEAACLLKEYKTKGNAAKYAKKVFGTTMHYEVAQENPFAQA